MIFIKDVDICEIDDGDETFRISENLDSPPLTASLLAVGQLNPVILLEKDSRKIIVCGFRRIRAMRRLAISRISARLLTDEDCRGAHPFEFALRDNLSRGQLNPLENARAIYGLQNLCGISRSRIIQEYLPLLGLPPHENVLSGYETLRAARHELRRRLEEGLLTFSTVERLAKLSGEEQDRFASLATVVRMSAGTQKKVLELLDDLRGMTGNAFTAPLDTPEIRELSGDAAATPFQKGEKLYETLYRLRYPRVSRARENFTARRNSLGLPGAIRIIPHPYFETSGLRVEFDASDAGRFRELAGTLQKASQSPELENLFRIEE